MAAQVLKNAYSYLYCFTGYALGKAYLGFTETEGNA